MILEKPWIGEKKKMRRLQHRIIEGRVPSRDRGPGGISSDDIPS